MSLPLLVTLLFADAGTKQEAAPRPLSCLCRHYACEPRRSSGRWFLAIPAQAGPDLFVPYDDGQHKTWAERLDAPDGKDVFRPLYRPGPIAEVTTQDDDPGRVRIEPLFAATYGRTQREVDLVRIDFLGVRLRVNRKVAPAFEKVASRLKPVVANDPATRPFLRGLGGTFVWRKIAGTSRQSAHSYGVSLDLSPALSDYWRWQRGPPRWKNRVPQSIVDAFEAEGFIWGGRWFHYDTMHFEYRPELLDPACAAAQD